MQTVILLSLALGIGLILLLIVINQHEEDLKWRKR